MTTRSPVESFGRSPAGKRSSWALSACSNDASRLAGSMRASDRETLGAPIEPELAGRRHVAEERRCGDDGRAREVALAAQSHAILPIAIEGRDGALSGAQRVGSLAEAGAAPR